ncbi:MAG: hypothetical protein ACKD6N_06485 [Candidatus Bathyarchaeota archaeon]
MKKRVKHSKTKTKTTFTLIIITVLTLSVLAIIPLLNKPVENKTQPQTTNTTPPIKILNKIIPPNYTFGLPFDGGLVSGMDVVFLQNPNQKISIRFTAKTSGIATKLVIYTFAYQGEPTINVGLREDNKGQPKNQWINMNAYNTITPPSKQGFITVQLKSNIEIKKGQVYHIYIEAAENQLNGTLAMRTYRTNGFAQPYNPEDPDILWSDSKMNILFYDGQNWREQNKWPIFAIEYTDGKIEGQPYSLIAPWVVWGSTYVGQMITPASNYTVGKIAFVVSLKSGLSQDNLYYQIRNSTNHILVEGVFIEKNQLTSKQQWVEVTLPTPVTLKAGQLYRIILLSPQSNLENAYYLYGHEFSYNHRIGYGGLQHQITSSHNGGNTWAENPDADAVYKITTS